MWTVIYIASTSRQAEKICKRLAAEGFLARQRQASTTRQQYEILVPASELDDIKELLNDILHSSYSS